jgi:acetyl-CoA C-acetyltransferase
MPEAWVIDAVRTPRGRGKAEVGRLSGVHPQQLFGQTLNALQARNGFDPADVEDVVAGCVSAVGEQGACIARNGVLAAGWDARSASGVTLNRFCGSGQQAVNFAAMGVMAGMQDLVIGGGIESMSRVPMGSAGGGLDGKDRELQSRHPLVPQGISADLIATREGFSRRECDAFAAESQARAALAMEEGRFAKSLISVEDAEGKVVLEVDEHPRPGTTADALAKLPASFERLGTQVPDGRDKTLDEMALSVYPEVGEISHVHTAGNSSGIVDGASAVLLATPHYAKAHGLKPRARMD